MDNLQLYIESLIFAATKAMTLKEIKGTLNAHLEKGIKEKDIVAALEGLGNKYDNDKYPFEIIEIAGGYQFMTKGTYYPLVSKYLQLESKKKLSRAALETLAIVSYKQPITKSVVESIRGVNCDYALQKLLEKELVQIEGRAEGPGRPLLYATSEKFMNHFGLKDLNDLPKIKEFEMPENEVGPKDVNDVPGPAQEEGNNEPGDIAEAGEVFNLPSDDMMEENKVDPNHDKVAAEDVDTNQEQGIESESSIDEDSVQDAAIEEKSSVAEDVDTSQEQVIDSESSIVVDSVQDAAIEENSSVAEDVISDEEE